MGGRGNENCWKGVGLWGTPSPFTVYGLTKLWADLLFGYGPNTLRFPRAVGLLRDGLISHIKVQAKPGKCRGGRSRSIGWDEERPERRFDR
jgi:hypothetical protein